MAELYCAHIDQSFDRTVDSLIHFLCPFLWKGELYRIDHANTKAALVSLPFRPVRLASQYELCYAQCLLPVDTRICFLSSSLPLHSFSISPLLTEDWVSLLLNMRWMFCVPDIHSSHPFQANDLGMKTFSSPLQPLFHSLSLSVPPFLFKWDRGMYSQCCLTEPTW